MRDRLEQRAWSGRLQQEGVLKECPQLGEGGGAWVPIYTPASVPVPVPVPVPADLLQARPAGSREAAKYQMAQLGRGGGGGQEGVYAVLYCVVQYSTVMYCTVQYITVLHCTV